MVQHDNLKIVIAGKENPKLYRDLVSLEVELDEELAGMFRMKIGLLLKADGSWDYIDDESLTLWKQVTITAGVEDDTQQLISGYVTHVRPFFSSGLDESYLEIWGMDATVLMDRRDKVKDWSGRKDSEIASEVFKLYHLTPQVEDTGVILEENVQRETDIQFLRRLALRNGYECYVDGNTAYFQTARLSASSQAALLVQADCRSNINQFQLEVNALATANVSMSQIDHDTGDVLNAASLPARQKALGKNGADSFLGPKMPPGLVAIGTTVTTGKPEMDVLCQGLYNEGEWFVTGEGDVAANQYGSVLKTHAPVTIKGIGATHSGTYYVTHVNHIFNADGYLQRFSVKRNGLMLTGMEAA